DIFMNKNWNILQPDIKAAEEIREALQCSPVIAAVLVNRRIVSPEDASRFLNPSLQNLRSPFSIKDMDVAVRRIHTAITRNERILIFGDYDADGVTATTILFEFLRYAGADVSYYIPHRVTEGYSLKPGHISDYASPNHISLIITVDCGSKSHEAVSAASEAGIDIIITDHHTISGDPPRALAIVNPRRRDCTAGFDNLAGVGVAFYLMVCLRKYLREKDFWQNRPEPNLKHFCDLVAIGTIADVVPLGDENRILSKTGLEVIGSALRPGVKALIRSCGISGHSVDTDDIAFRMAPRLNAAGRIGHAKDAVALLTTDDAEDAKKIASSLNQMNQRRQEIEKKMIEEISDCLKASPHLLMQKTLVLSDPRWHEGVLGIAASKIVEKYFRPVILISTKNGLGKGSGRSIPFIDLHTGLVACSGDLEFFGGHSMAAGLTIRTENIPLFQKNFEKTVREMTGNRDFLQTISIDYELNFNNISDGLINELESLEPFGEGSREPLFMTRNVRVVSSRIVGKNHRRMKLKQGSGRIMEAIHFNIDPDTMKGRFDQMAFRLRWNRWNGRKTAQIIVEEV
ncbi:single-stranded-DNA-specific exonuclease RecJ, partial [Desulfococcaceae bacterium HSG8]|nr:single-stranded-DNA-specific exonuclease RecJ [Desulfococcaceae bacterium HSG8]